MATDNKVKIPRLLLLLPLAGLVAGLFLAWEYSLWFQDQERERLGERLIRQADEIEHDLNRHYYKMAGYLAGLEEVQARLEGKPGPAGLSVDPLLEHSKGLAGVDILYLMDSAGTVLASTDPRLTGQNFAFRPYFTSARLGVGETYLAKGQKTDQRGLYYSHGVFSGGKFLGAVVIKAFPQALDSVLETRDGIAGLASPEGVVFSATQSDLIFKTLKPLSNTQHTKLQASNQFPGEALPALDWQGEGSVRQVGGQTFTYLERTLASPRGWRVFLLVEQRHPWGLMALIVFALGGGSVMGYVLSVGWLRKRHLAELQAQVASQEAEKASLLAAESRFREYFEQSIVGMGTLDAAGRLQLANRKLLELLELPEALLRQTEWLSFSDPETAAEEKRLFEAVVSGAEPSCLLDKKLVGRRGHERFVTVALRGIKDQNQAISALFVLVLDITDRKQAAEELLVTQKLTAVGQLASGISHDFSNIIGGIIGLTELILLDSDPAEEKTEFAQAILSAAQRAGAMTQKLLAFSRRTPLQNTQTDLHAVIRETLTLLTPGVDKRIQVVTDLRASEPGVIGDPSRLVTAVMNLCINAQDAMPEGGQLTLTTENLRRGGRAWLLLSVRDTGIGMDDVTRSRIFEPFFTTKAVGKGTGLGLSMVYSTVQDHGGSIEVDSHPNQGTTMRLWLPCAAMDALAPVMDGQPIQGAGHILLIDDEAPLRLATSRLLSGLGYSVEEARDGQQALDKAKASKRAYDVVLLDMRMPGLSTEEVVTGLLALRPNQKILLISGFPDEEVLQRLYKRGVTAFLAKPFDRLSLSKTVAGVISGSELPVPN